MLSEPHTMHIDNLVLAAAVKPTRHKPAPRWLPIAALCAGLVFSGASQAADFGPFTLNAFVKVEAVRTSNACPDCQVAPGVGKDFKWGDTIAAGKSYGNEDSHVVLFQPWLGVKFDLGGGYKLSGLVSRRWRDGKEDIPGFWYDKNIALSHEDYGRVAIGSMTTRSWSLADYPYGSKIGVSDAWASSGAGYGLLGQAVRVTTRPLDVFDGNLVLEATYDSGNPRFKIHKPQFIELYAQYHRGPLVIDAMYQDSRNGGPAAWGHGPFSALFYDASADALLGQSGQSMAMLMARYQLNVNVELLAGVRRNRWSGAHAVVVQPNARGDLWNFPFNVNWGGALVYANADGTSYVVNNPGYAATSVDYSGGLVYRTGKWTAHTGFAYLGKANTQNPSERGQSNAALINTVGLNYDFGRGLQVYGLAGMVNYKRLGLSPMSMPGNASFTNVDSRVSTKGHWIGVGAVYVF